MKTWFTHVIFLIINFGGLAIGGLYTGKGAVNVVSTAGQGSMDATGLGLWCRLVHHYDLFQHLPR